MTFAWPPALLALAAVPLLVWGYVLLIRRRARRAEELAAQGFAPSAATQRLRTRRHIPYACFLVGLTSLLFGVARPQAKVTTSRPEGTVILAFDVSNSMRADDLLPTRMDAAKTAAKSFVAAQPNNVKIGVVAFSDGALQTSAPTDDRKAVLEAIDRLKPAGGTALGQGLFSALSAIAGKPLTPPTTVSPDGGAGPAPTPVNPDDSAAQASIGYFGSAAIVVLSDGENTVEPKPRDVAELASVAGVKIYAVGIGKLEGTVVQIDGFSVATKLDEESLQEIAKVTGGKYFRADDAESLKQVYQSIKLEAKPQTKKTELTGLFSGLGAALLVLGSVLSLGWFARLV